MILYCILLHSTITLAVFIRIITMSVMIVEAHRWNDSALYLIAQHNFYTILCK